MMKQKSKIAARQRKLGHQWNDYMKSVEINVFIKNDISAEAGEEKEELMLILILEQCFTSLCSCSLVK